MFSSEYLMLGNDSMKFPTQKHEFFSFLCLVRPDLSIAILNPCLKFEVINMCIFLRSEIFGSHIIEVEY